MTDSVNNVADDDVLIIDDDSDDDHSNDHSINSTLNEQKADEAGGVRCKNPWHGKWGGCDTQLKWPSQIPKIAQYIFQILAYEPAGHKSQKEKKSSVQYVFREPTISQLGQRYNQDAVKDDLQQQKALSRRQSENSQIQAQLEKLDKLDIPDEEKAKQAKQLRMLAFVNPGKFMDDFDPERSAREMKKMNRRLYKEKNIRKNQLYDDDGRLLSSKQDLCDCLDVECPGCHFPCPKCKSEKCGGECRCNRKWIYEYVESEGTGNTFTWPPEVKP